MADDPKPLGKHAYIDQDTTDAFLDGPEPLRTYDGVVRETTWEDIERRLKAGPTVRLPTDWYGRGD